MGNTQAPVVSWDHPYPATAEGTQERMMPLIDYLTWRFATYGDEAANFFALNDKKFEFEQICYLLALNDYLVVMSRFGENAVQEVVVFKLETLRLLLQRSLWKQQLAHKQRLITGSTFASLGLGVSLVLVTPAVLGAIGFTASGVAAGSTAAAIQSAVYGGYTTGLFSAAQSVGALGAVSIGTGIGVSTSAAAIGAGIGTGIAFCSEPGQGTTQQTTEKAQLKFSWENNLTLEQLVENIHRKTEVAGSRENV